MNTPPAADIEAIRKRHEDDEHADSAITKRLQYPLSYYACAHRDRATLLNLLSRPAARGGDENLQADTAHHADAAPVSPPDRHAGGTGVGDTSLPPVGPTITQGGLTREAILAAVHRGQDAHTAQAFKDYCKETKPESEYITDAILALTASTDREGVEALTEGLPLKLTGTRAFQQGVFDAGVEHGKALAESALEAAQVKVAGLVALIQKAFASRQWTVSAANNQHMHAQAYQEIEAYIEAIKSGVVVEKDEKPS